MEHALIDELSMTRSVLNPVAPIGVGTPEVESLVSYFCRLAMSHCISTTNLGRQVVAAMQWEFSKNHTWQSANFSGMSDAAGEWANALSTLTSVENLESLTMRPWCEVIAERSPRPASARWCPQCLAEDRAAGVAPYFRLAWDVGTVTACAKHKIKLAHVCPDCAAVNTRHNSSYVVPGWCTSCGVFLGGIENSVPPATPSEMWIAIQIGAILAIQSSLSSLPTRQALVGGVRELVDRLDRGKSATFARRIGLGKATVHNWLKDGGIPTLPALLRIVSQTGIALPDLLTGNVTECPEASAEIIELHTLFPETKKRAPRNPHNWEKIRAEMVAPDGPSAFISLTDMARRLNINRRQIYRNAKDEAHILAERWSEHQRRGAEQNRKKTSDLVAQIYPKIVAQGRAVNLRELMAHIPSDSDVTLRNVFKLLREMKEKEDTV